MYEIRTTKAYRTALKRVARHKDFNLKSLEDAIDILQTGSELPPRYRDHQLSGKLKQFRECHITSDILLIYQTHNDILVLLLVDIGSHATLFNQ